MSAALSVLLSCAYLALPDNQIEMKILKRKINMSQEDTVFLGTKEVAKILGCSVPTARNIMRRYDFPLIRVGKNLKVSRKALEEWAMKRHA